MLVLFRVGILATIFICQASVAQTSDNDLKVGFVNIRKLMVQAPQLGQIKSKLSAEFEKQTQSIISLRNKSSQLKEKYDSIKDKKELLKLQKNIAEKQLLIIKQQKRLDDDYNLRRNEEISKLQMLIVKMVAKVSIEKKIDIVFNNTGVVFRSERIDITPKVFKYLSGQVIE